MSELWPRVQRENDDAAMTDADRAFARALAWRSVAYSLAHHDGAFEDIQDPTGPEACHYVLHHVSSDHSSFYPPSALNRHESGVVVVRVIFDESGRVIGAETAAAAPEELFSPAGEALVRTISMARAPDAAPNCVLPHRRFIAITFSS